MPFLLGILISLQFNLNRNTFMFLSAVTAVILVVYLLGKHSRNKVYGHILVIMTDLFLVLTGINCCYHYNALNDAGCYVNKIDTNAEQEWIARIKDLPVEKEKTYRLQTELMAVKKGERFEDATGVIQVYIKKPFRKDQIQPGHVFLMRGKLNAIGPPQNPHEFDYRRFMSDRNIFHVSFLDSQNVFLTGIMGGNPLLNWGLRIKQNVIEILRDSELSKPAAEFCIALLTGYDDEISPETINAFAHSGTLHVLSVSGWHTGILYIVLVFLFNIIDKHNRYKGIRVIFLITALFLFTLMTGFSAPVLRAAIMLTLLSIGKYYFTYSVNNNINILAVSAFMILFFEPYLLRDAGFLLSYSAIIGIVCFEPAITGLWHLENKYLKRVWQLCSVSISAQLSTLPVTLYLFHQFPLWFVFSNLFIIPICSVIIYLSFLLIMKLKIVTALINSLCAFVFWMVRLTDVPVIGYADKIDFNFMDACLLISLIIFGSLFISKRSYANGLAMLICIITWQTLSVITVIGKKSSSSFSVYSINRSTAFDLKDRTKLFFCSNAGENNYAYHVKPNHTFYNYPDIYQLNVDYLRTGDFSLFNYKDPGQEKLLQFLKPEYLLVSNNVQIKNIPAAVKLLIADASNSYRQTTQLREQCERSGIKFISIRESGYLSLNLSSNEIKDR